MLEKISSLDDMKALMTELRRMEVKFLYDFYGSLQDFSSKKFLPQWLQKKGVKSVFVSEKGSDVLLKLNASVSNKLSAVVYDLETPDLNGLQFLASLEKKPEIKSKCKIILVVPELSAEVKDRLMGMGADALVLRPISEETMQAAFQRMGLAT